MLFLAYVLTFLTEAFVFMIEPCDTFHSCHFKCQNSRDEFVVCSFDRFIHQNYFFLCSFVRENVQMFDNFSFSKLVFFHFVHFTWRNGVLPWLVLDTNLPVAPSLDEQINETIWNGITSKLVLLVVIWLPRLNISKSELFLSAHVYNDARKDPAWKRFVFDSFRMCTVKQE